MTHVLGDMHQPLHNMSLYTSHFKSGDRGGNDVKVELKIDQSELKYEMDDTHDLKEIKELHALWDSVLG